MNYVLTVTKGYSYLRVMVIQIDVYPVGKNLIHTTRMLPALVHVTTSMLSTSNPRT
jgi:hypothetical protein